MEVPLRGGSEAERAERDEMLTLDGRKRAELGGALEVETIHPLAQKRRRSFCRTANQKNQIKVEIIHQGASNIRPKLQFSCPFKKLFDSLRWVSETSFISKEIAFIQAKINGV